MMFKTNIKNAPIITGKRLVPKKTGESDSSNTILSGVSSDSGGQKSVAISDFKVQVRSVQITRQQSTFQKIFSPIAEKKISEASENDMQFLNKWPKTSKNFSQKIERETPRIQQSANFHNENITGKAIDLEVHEISRQSNFTTLFKSSKHKLEQCNSQLEYFDIFKKENSRILEKKYSEIRLLNEKIQNLLEVKEQNMKQIFSKNKKIDELSNENRFKDLKIKQLQTKRQTDQRKLQQSGRKRPGSNSAFEEESSLLKKSNTDWGIKLSTLKKQKEATILDLSYSIQTLKTQREKEINEIRQNSSKQITKIEKHYQDVISSLNKSFSAQNSAQKKKFEEEKASQQKKSQQEQETLRKFYDKKVEDITKIYEEKLFNFKNLPKENEEAVRKINLQHQAEIQVLKRELVQQKEIFLKSQQSSLEEERKKYNDIIRIINNKNREFEGEIEKLKILCHEKVNQIQNLQLDLKKKEKIDWDKQKLIELEKSKYKRMEDLWRDEKKKNDVLEPEIQKLRKKMVEEQKENKVLSQKVAHLTQQIAFKNSSHDQSMMKLKETYSKMITQKNRQITANKNQMKNQSSEIIGLKEVVKEVERLNEGLSRQLEEVKNKTQQQIHLALKEKQNQKEIYQQWLQAKEDQNKELKMILEAKEKAVVQGQKTHRGLLIDNAEKSRKIENLEQTIQKEKEKIIELENNVEIEKSRAIRAMDQEYANIKSKLTEISPKIATIFPLLTKCENMKSSLSSNLSNLLNESIEQQSELLSIKQKVQKQSSEKILELLSCKDKQNEKLCLENIRLEKQLKYLHSAGEKRQNEEIRQLAFQKEGQQLEFYQEQQREDVKIQKIGVDIGCGVCKQYKDFGFGEQSIVDRIQVHVQCEQKEFYQFGCGDSFIHIKDQETGTLIEVAAFGCGVNIYTENVDEQIQCKNIWVEQVGCGELELQETCQKGTQWSQDQGKQRIQTGVNTLQQQCKIKTDFETQTTVKETFKQEIQVSIIEEEQKSDGDKNLQEEESQQSLSAKDGKSGHQGSQSQKDDESSAKEEDERENVEGKREAEVNENLEDEIREQKQEDDESPFTEEKYSVNELLDELQQKEYVIEEMSQCIQDYKEMVWEMKQRLEYGEDYETNYRQILDIFNLGTEDVGRETHKYLIEIINGYTAKMNDMISYVQKIEELNNQNESLNASKKKFMKELKKCKTLIEKVELQNQDLEKRLNEEIFKNQKLEAEAKELNLLVQETNQALTGAKAKILNYKLNSQSSINEEKEEQLNNILEEQPFKEDILQDRTGLCQNDIDEVNQKQKLPEKKIKQANEAENLQKQESDIEGKDQGKEKEETEIQEYIQSQIQINILEVSDDDQDQTWEAHHHQISENENAQTFTAQTLHFNQLFLEQKNEEKERGDPQSEENQQESIQRLQEKAEKERKTCGDLMKQFEQRQKHIRSEKVKKREQHFQKNRRFDNKKSLKKKR